MGDAQQTFRAMVFKEGDEWIGHCLDLDIASSGTTRHLALEALVEAIQLQLAYARETNNFEHLFRPAPVDAWRRLAQILNGPHQTLRWMIGEAPAGSGIDLLEAQLVAA